MKDHAKLLTKLQLYGVDISWFSLVLRIIPRVSASLTLWVTQTFQLYFPTTSIGVFQGSSVGPLLFCVFANGLSLFAEGAVVVPYTDDTQILVSGNVIFRHPQRSLTSQEAPAIVNHLRAGQNALVLSQV